MRARAPSAAVFALAAGVVAADDWPQWRGPRGTGVSSEKGLPTRWGPDDVAWKARLGGLGISSPIVWGDRVFVTSQTGRAALRPGRHPTLARGPEANAEKPLGATTEAGGAEGGVRFIVEAFDRRDGRRLWQYALEAEGPLPEVHEKHNLASPSPVTDGAHVYAWFGTGQLVALGLDGTFAWQKNLGKEYGPFDIAWGHGSSPTLHGDTVILLCDHEPASYLLALDKRTGEVRWKTDRPKGSVSYATPTVVSTASGDELVVNSTTRVDGYDPATGKLLWWAGEPHRFAIPVPAYHDGTLYMSRGYRSGPYMAVRAGGRGDVSKTHVAWSVPTGAPYVSSLLHYAGLIYMANDVGVVTAVDPKTGEKVWQERVEGIFTASPVGADGKVYLVSETGETIVLAAGPEPKVLARNSVGERSVATPAFAPGRIFIRTDNHLVAVGR
ncbi:MAG TPA: PQQ-binding-like beta-propeller repeat protein [Vicinamibacteria bacterium]|nr:PQQ-binding-like beta-propeller repeat protein [Vicinamibacteria bacterium]